MAVGRSTGLDNLEIFSDLFYLHSIGTAFVVEAWSTLAILQDLLERGLEQAVGHLVTVSGTGGWWLTRALDILSIKMLSKSVNCEYDVSNERSRWDIFSVLPVLPLSLTPRIWADT